MRRFLVLFLVFLLPVQVMAAALPAYSPKFGNALAGVTQQKVAARGFAANDPRFVATQAAMGTALTAVATGLAVAAGAPLWATIAIGAVTAGAVALGIDAVTSWLFNEDGTVTNASAPSGSGDSGGGAGLQYWANDIYYQKVFYGGWADVALQNAISYVYGNATVPSTVSWGAPTPACESGAGTVCTGYVVQSCPDCSPVNRPWTIRVEGPSWTPPANGVSVAPPPPAPAVPKTIADAVADVPESDMVKPASPALVAKAANNAWQWAAEQPGYQGLPFLASDPITTSDVASWQANNPASYPTVSDMLAPAVSSGTTVAQPVAPGTSASPGISTAPAGTPQVNLGTDPVVPLPMLEATPTAQMILNPLLNLMPDLKTFVVPSHASECPKPSMSLFGRSLVLDGHCNLLDAIRPTLYAVMAAVWIVLALFIILAA